MSKLSDVRNKVSAQRNKMEEQKRALEEKTNRIRSVALEVINSPTFILQSAAVSQGESIEAVVNAVVPKIAEAITDPINNFLDDCRARNLTEEQIHDIVAKANTLCRFVPENASYATKLSHVANYIQDNPKLGSFIDICQTSDLSIEQVESFVHKINDVYKFTSEDAPFQETFQKVFAYIQENPKMFEDLAHSRSLWQN